MQDRVLILSAIFFALLICIVNSLGAMLVPFAVGFVGAYLMDKPVSYLQKLRIPRVFGTLLVMMLFISFIGSLMMIAIPFIKNEIMILSNKMPVLMSHIYAMIDPSLDFLALHLPTENIENIKSQLTGQIGNMLSWVVNLVLSVLSSSLAIANLLSLVVITPVVMFYLTKDWLTILNNIKDILPTKYKKPIEIHAKEVDKNLSSYAKGQLLVCCILSVMYSIGLSIVGLKNAVLVGVIAGFLSFIPYLGAFIGFVLSVVIHVTNIATWNPITLIAIVFLSIQTIEGYFLTPRFVGNRIGAHPVFILFILLAGANWLGFFGVVIALPMTAVITSIGKSILRYNRSHLNNH